MTYFIEIENLLINYFSTHTNENEVSACTLSTIKKTLEKELDDVYIDICKDAIRYATFGSKWFKMTDTTVKLMRKKTFRKLVTPEYVMDIYNWDIPENILGKYIEIITNYK